MVPKTQQTEKAEPKHQASSAEVREWLADRRDELANQLQEALEATVFSNRFLLPPGRLPRVAQAEADALLEFLKTGKANHIREQGDKMRLIPFIYDSGFD